MEKKLHKSSRRASGKGNLEVIIASPAEEDP
jgi:hypothetical protein